jgi:hypothetical protein
MPLAGTPTSFAMVTKVALSIAFGKRLIEGQDTCGLAMRLDTHQCRFHRLLHLRVARSAEMALVSVKIGRSNEDTIHTVREPISSLAVWE